MMSGHVESTSWPGGQGGGPTCSHGYNTSKSTSSTHILKPATSHSNSLHRTLGFFHFCSFLYLLLLFMTYKTYKLQNCAFVSVCLCVCLLYDEVSGVTVLPGYDRLYVHRSVFVCVCPGVC